MTPTSNRSIIKAEGVTKTFQIPHERVDSLKGRATQLFRRIPTERYTALQDITFDIRPGEFFGIVGRNGSGKSTLLKILAGIYRSTSGSVEVNGRLTTFIELGVGFNFELSGRDNVFLNGAILGMTRKEIEEKFDEIVAFAELEEFIDQKIKNYSSGMQVRLAFAVAIQVDADVILIDEVLAVGDFNFQQKCFDVFRRLKAEGKTIIFVTHDMITVTDFCDRVLLIHNSKAAFLGSPNEASSMYLLLNNERASEQIEEETQKAIAAGQQSRLVKKVTLRDAHGKQKHVYATGEPLTIEVELVPNSGVENVGIAIFRGDDLYCYGTNTIIDQAKGELSKTARLTIKKLHLQSGKFYFKIGLFGKTDGDIKEYVDRVAPMRIQSDLARHGVVELDTHWELD